MNRSAFLLTMVCLSCKPVQFHVSASKTNLLADGYDTAVFRIEGSKEPPVLTITGNQSLASVTTPRWNGTQWAADLRAGIMPGVIRVLTKSGSHHVEQTLVLAPQITDAAGDGTPDFLRLDDESDRKAFRSWMTYLAELQFFMHPVSEITDCSALVRYSYREALRDHNAGWSPDAHLPLIPAQSSIRKYSFPHTPLGPRLFRVVQGSYSPSDLSNGAFAEFADARTIQQYNMFFVSRDLAHALPGDVLFYRRQTAKGRAYHSMVFLGNSRVKPDGEIYVVYHTGPDGTNHGEIRRLSLTQLLHFPDPQWQPIAANQHFLGVYRWNILKAPS